MKKLLLICRLLAGCADDPFAGTPREERMFFGMTQTLPGFNLTTPGQQVLECYTVGNIVRCY